MKVLGVSGSPLEDSNTDRAIKTVLRATGFESEFINLIDYFVAPYKACLGCIKTNRWAIEDDGIMLAEKAKQATALIIGGFTPYSSLDRGRKHLSNHSMLFAIYIDLCGENQVQQ